MSWRDLLAPAEVAVAPWWGGRDLQIGSRALRIAGDLPPEPGWHGFSVEGGRRSVWIGPAAAPDDWPGARKLVRGWLIGDRLVPEEAPFVPDAARVPDVARPVGLVEPGLARFDRVAAAAWDDGRYVFAGVEFPLGPEDDVARAYEDERPDVAAIPGVPPALDLAFRWATWRRVDAARRRAEAEAEARRLAEEAARQAREAERVAKVQALIGDAARRRDIAREDFEAAARAALQLSGARLLDWRPGHGDEAVVTWRLGPQRLQCVVHRHTLRVIDAGICLVDHHTGERGDTSFTLESLPGVVAQAEREGNLVVFRHA